MKKLLLLCFILLSITSIAQITDGAIITFDSTVVNYGTVSQGSEPYRKLSFKNTGNKTLIIEACVTTCHCYSAKCPLEKEILPGDTGHVVVRYDTERLGAISKTVTVKSNAINASNGNIYINVKGAVVPAPKKVEKDNFIYTLKDTLAGQIHTAEYLNKLMSEKKFDEAIKLFSKVQQEKIKAIQSNEQKFQKWCLAWTLNTLQLEKYINKIKKGKAHFIYEDGMWKINER